MFGGDDDDDFVPGNNSKLAALFSSKSFEGNSSLTYTAPKQPKRPFDKHESRTSTSHPAAEPNRPSKESSDNVLSIIIVKAVNTYKLLEGKYSLQGKLGAAILGNASTCVYQLLLYKGKQQHITNTKINSNFQFTVQASNYATFYDDNKQNWSIHFETIGDSEEFAREVCLARANAQGGKGIIKSLLTQELYVGEGPSANVGDSLEIFYSVRPFLDMKPGAVVESNLQAEKPQRVKIRKNVWEEGLIGASRGSKRIIVLPSNLVGPWKQQVAPDTRIIVEVEINRIKQVKVLAEGTVSTLASQADSGDSAVDSGTDDTSIKARGASISEALTASPKTNKANIISRMAKMGQATLPLKGAVVCNPSDSEETEEEIRSSTVKPLPVSKPSAKSRPVKVRTKLSSPSSPESTPPMGPLKPVNNPPHQVTMYQTLPVSWQQQQQPQLPYGMGQYGMGQMEGQLFPLVSQPAASSHQIFPAPPNNIVGTPTSMSSSENLFSVFMSETRTQNTEVRLGVAKVADKVDQMLAKLDSVQNLKPVTSNAAMDPSSLLASIQKVVLENEQLKAEVAEKGNKIELQNDRIYQLLNTNHKYLEQSNYTSNDHRHQEIVVANLQKMKTKLTEELCESKVRLESLLTEIETNKQESTKVSCDMASQIQNLQDELSSSKSVIVEQDMTLQQLKEKLQSSAEAIENQERTMATLKSFLLELQGSKEKAETSLNDVTQQLRLQKLEADDREKKLAEKYSVHVAALMEKGTNFQAQLDAKKASEMSNAKPFDDVKKVMNVVYKILLKEFIPERNYLGENIRTVLVTTIRDVTCQFLELQGVGLTVSKEPRFAAPLKEVHGLSMEGDTAKVSSDPTIISTNLHSNPPDDLKVQLNHIKQELHQRPKNTSLRDQDILPHDQSVPSDVKARVDGLDKCEPPTKLDGVGKSRESPPDNLVSGEHPLSRQERSSNVPDTPLQTPPGGAVLTSEHTTENKSVVGADAVPNDEKVCGDDKLSTKQLEGKVIKQLRESSLERNLWHSEPPPPPLADEDEDVDDWLA